jgi:hypothetical protein
MAKFTSCVFQKKEKANDHKERKGKVEIDHWLENRGSFVLGRPVTGHIFLENNYLKIYNTIIMFQRYK